MALLNGVFNTSLNPAELNKRSFASTILRLFPNGSAPMFALTSQSGKSKALSTTHGYFSKTMTFITATSTSGDTSSATNLLISSTTGMQAGMLLQNTRTRENVRILSVPDATHIMVTRAFGSVAAATINSADKFIHIGTAFEQNSTRPAARQLATAYISNYTQIFRNAWALTDTARASMSEMGYSNIAETRKDCAMFHSVDIESAIIWGQPKAPAAGPNGQPISATQGIIDALETYAAGNTTGAGSTTTYNQLVTMCEPFFKYSTDMSNPKERVAFGDAQAIRVLNEIGVLYGSIQITQDENSFGMNFQTFKFYKGTLRLIEHPLMNGLEMAGTLLVMDMAALKLAYMDGRDTKTEEYGANGKVVENGVDGVGGSLTSELAVELINPYSCGLITGLTAGA
jgi:hypothetical protein